MTPSPDELRGLLAGAGASDLAAQCRMQARENLDPEYSQFMVAVAARLTLLEAERERLREALEAIKAGDVPRAVKDRWRADGKPSKHDMCPHGVEMYADCSNCTADYIDTVLNALPQGEG